MQFYFEKKSKVLYTFALRFFVHLLPILTNDLPKATLSLFEEGAI